MQERETYDRMEKHEELNQRNAQDEVLLYDRMCSLTIECVLLLYASSCAYIRM